MSTLIRVPPPDTSRHYYVEDDGRVVPFYEIEYADKKRKGEFRPVKITDARKHNAVPSVNQSRSRIRKPAIERWRIAKYLEEGLTFPFGDRSIDECIPEIIENVDAALDAAPSLGTAYHAAVAEVIMAKWPGVSNE
ncbi:MAG: hypothetical protein AMJ65_09705 [Phycisphaerae bacterium SG8_4]|nr:MAG: hypothetical protein AMJ65_09705 [Phycisphaerae bacterium SG8_4]